MRNTTSLVLHLHGSDFPHLYTPTGLKIVSLETSSGCIIEKKEVHVEEVGLCNETSCSTTSTAQTALGRHCLPFRRSSITFLSTISMDYKTLQCRRTNTEIGRFFVSPLRGQHRADTRVGENSRELLLDTSQNHLQFESTSSVGVQYRKLTNTF